MLSTCNAEMFPYSKSKASLSVLLALAAITHDVCSRKIPPLCLVGCASLWLGCEYDCRSEYQYISITHPMVMETCSKNCEQQRLTCMQQSPDPVCKKTAMDMTMYSAFKKKAKKTVLTPPTTPPPTPPPFPNGTQGR